MTPCLRAQALECLSECSPTSKVSRVLALNLQDPVDPDAVLTPAVPVPGRPEKPELVDPKLVSMRSVHTEEGRIALLHAIAHIEFNAINLALDAAWRYPGMPERFYRQWLKVAQEEAYHFSLLCGRLQDFDVQYGDLPAHNGLWEMAEKTSGDLLARLALVPRTLEARGLDVTPAMRQKFLSVGDQASADILAVLLRDEVGHVSLGNEWYLHFCREAGQGPIEVYAELLERYQVSKPRGPFNEAARLQAGFTQQEIDWLNSLH